MSNSTGPRMAPEQQALNDLWEEHIRDEFVTRDTEATLDTMVPDAYVNHVPVMTGGVGREALREFHSRHVIPQMPPNTEAGASQRILSADRRRGNGTEGDGPSRPSNELIRRAKGR